MTWNCQPSGLWWGHWKESTNISGRLQISLGKLLASTQTDFRHLQRMESLQKKGKEKIKPECSTPFGIIAPFPSNASVPFSRSPLRLGLSLLYGSYWVALFAEEPKWCGAKDSVSVLLCNKNKQAESRRHQRCIHLQKPFPPLRRTILTLIRLLVICPSHPHSCHPQLLRFTLHTFANSWEKDIYQDETGTWTPKGLRGQSSHWLALCSENNDFWIPRAEVTGAYKNQAVTAGKRLCVTTESTKGKNFETF